MLNGRVTRLQYFFSKLLFILPVGFALLLFFLLEQLTKQGYLLEFTSYISSTLFIFFLLGMVWLTIGIVFMLGAAIRRLHDINLSGWLLLISLIPTVNFIFELFLTFYPGSDGDNKYGPPPSSKLSIKSILLGE